MVGSSCQAPDGVDIHLVPDAFGRIADLVNSMTTQGLGSACKIRQMKEAMPNKLARNITELKERCGQKKKGKQVREKRGGRPPKPKGKAKGKDHALL